MASTNKKATAIKATVFDFMGTCLDWCSAVTAGLPSNIPKDQRRSFSLEWRVAYFRENERRVQASLPTENIDETLARTLDQLLASPSHSTLAAHLPAAARAAAVAAWHAQPAWPDVAPALQRLRERVGCELFVHGNGTTRLQLDLARSSGLRYDLLMSSQMVGLLKPEREAYLRALALVGRRPEECVLVAAHVYDLRGAKKVGMRTIYVRRATDDVHEDLEGIENEFDAVLDDMDGLAEAVQNL